VLGLLAHCSLMVFLQNEFLRTNGYKVDINLFIRERANKCQVE